MRSGQAASLRGCEWNVCPVLPAPGALPASRGSGPTPALGFSARLSMGVTHLHAALLLWGHQSRWSTAAQLHCGLISAGDVCDAALSIRSPSEVLRVVTSTHPFWETESSPEQQPRPCAEGPSATRRSRAAAALQTPDPGLCTLCPECGVHGNLCTHPASRSHPTKGNFSVHKYLHIIKNDPDPSD